jgi:ketopantoate reductase
MNFRIAVVGMGAIGSYYGANLPMAAATLRGEPLRRARAVGATAPRLEMVYALLKALGKEGGSRIAARINNRSS